MTTEAPEANARDPAVCRNTCGVTPVSWLSLAAFSRRSANQSRADPGAVVVGEHQRFRRTILYVFGK